MRTSGLFVVVLAVLALLVGDAATGFASRLAGRLAFAAAAVAGTVAQRSGIDGDNVFHSRPPISSGISIIHDLRALVNTD